MRRIEVVASLALTCSLACAPTPSPHASCSARLPPETARVAGGRFVDARGDAFVPRGIGSYPLLDLAGRGAMLERPLVRTGAYLDGGSHPGRIRDDDGSLREEGLVALDRVIAEADAHGVRLVLALVNHWPDYGGAPAVLRMVAPDEALPVTAFYTDARAIDAQAAYVRAILTRTNTITAERYADARAIFAWELANEPRCEGCDPAVLARWARRMSDAVREAGATQPIAWGGVGYVSAHGEEFDRIAAEGGVDVMTLHLYPDLGGALSAGDGSAHALYGAIAAGAEAIRDRAARARRAGVALLVEEAGWRGVDPATRDRERALVLGAWADVAHAEGVSLMPWMIGEPDRPDYDGYLFDVARDDATVGVLGCP